MAKPLRYANGNHSAAIPVGRYVAVGSSVAACKAISTEKPEIQEIANKLHQLQLQESHLNIQVVDDTALIDTSLLAKGRKLIKNPRQETNNGKKRPQHKAVRKEYWKMKKIVVRYSRAEMEALSFEDVEYQMNKWTAVYRGLAASVAAEYDGLAASAAVGIKKPDFYFDRRPLLEKPHNAEAMNAIGKRSPLKIFLH